MGYDNKLSNRLFFLCQSRFIDSTLLIFSTLMSNFFIYTQNAWTICFLWSFFFWICSVAFCIRWCNWMMCWRWCALKHFFHVQFFFVHIQYDKDNICTINASRWINISTRMRNWTNWSNRFDRRTSDTLNHILRQWNLF